MAKSTKIITMIGIAATLFYAVAIFIWTNNKNTVLYEKSNQTVNNEDLDVSSKFGAESSIDTSGVTDLLKENGVSEEKIKDMQKTASGATIMGDALPAVEYRTLHDAEEAFGYYLGLHNNLESLTEYKLSAMHIINSEFMQGTFENSDSTKSLVVKTSKIKSDSEMASVYTDMKYISNESLYGVGVKLKGKDNKDTLNVASFTTKNGKAYVVSSAAGLGRTEMYDLLAELILNIQSMEDWQQ